jgi:Zn-dependent protease
MDSYTSVEDMSAQFHRAVADIFSVHDVTFGYKGGKTVRLRGQLLVDAHVAYERIKTRFEELGHTPLLRRVNGMDVIFAIPGSLSRSPSKRRAWIAGVLFLMTLVSVLHMGAVMDQVPPSKLFSLPGLMRGWPFALSLLSILTAHELGHYFVARRFGTPVSLPHFIPMPLSPLGTMGAVINMQGPPRNRRQLVAIGAAGPLAGLVFAVPILILGLLLSDVRHIPWGVPMLVEGNSLLYMLLKLLIFGRRLPSGGMDVFLHPVAFAGWAGLLVTGLNLIPAGPLDGGHIVYGLLGRRARWLNRIVIALLALLGFVMHWQGWFLWAGLLFFFSQRPTPLLDDITELDTSHRLLALLMVLLFAFTFVPKPLGNGGL